MIEKNIPAILPLLFLGSAIFVSMIGFWKKNLVYLITISAVFISSLLSIYGFYYVITNSTIRYFFSGWIPPIGIEYLYDNLSAFVSMVINSIALLVLINGYKLVKNEIENSLVAYYSIVLLLLGGFNGMIITGDLFNLYVFIEISSLSGYALIAVGERNAPFAAFRYLILGTIGASFYLIGVGFLYFVSGTLNMNDLALMIPKLKENSTIIVAIIFIVIGIGIKMAIFPMHGWLPDSYTFAPSTSSSLIAPIGTKVAAYVLLRLLFFVFGIDLFSKELPIETLLTIFSSAGILFGSIMAIAQKELKRMLAYSSVAQIGYIALGIGLVNPYGFIGAVLHILNHAMMKATLFLVAGNLRLKEGHSDISQFDDSFRKKYPYTMAIFTVAALSMIGLPPMVGFFSKWYLVLGSIENSQWLFLAVILISSLLNAIYFFNILEKVYMKNKNAPFDEHISSEKMFRNEVDIFMLAPIIILAVAIVILGILNTIVVNQIYKMMPNGLF